MRPAAPLCRFGIGCALSIAAIACSTRAPQPSDAPAASTSPPVDPAEALESARVAPLRTFERELRKRLDARALPSSETAFGADPWTIRALNAPIGGAHFVGVLRGRSVVVLLDADLNEISRAPAPRSTTALAIAPNGTIVVGGELSNEVVSFAIDAAPNAHFRRTTATRLPADGIRDIAIGDDGVIAAVDERGQRVHWIAGATTSSFATCRGATQLVRTKSALVVVCALEHEIRVTPVANRAPVSAREVRIANDGPFFGAAAIEDADGILVAAGGVENHVLDRTQGSFGFIDSFVHLFRVRPSATEPSVVARLNVAEHGIVTPKLVALEGERVSVVGYGTPDRVTFALPTGAVVAREALAPGIRSAAGKRGLTAYADPLLDAWVVQSERGMRVVPVPDADAPPRSEESRLGEALVFTTAMAPFNKSEGRLSRFTCETCHFEGTTDGRVHHTGRGDVRATTKPILGLYNNKPHFTRALDPDLAVLSMNEFRAANAKSDHDPWFSLEPKDVPWLAHLALPAKTHPPEELRRAFMAFLAEFTHRPNVRTLGRSAFDADERRGAEVFRDHCERCHSASHAADLDEHVPFAEWEKHVFSSESPLVWASADYEKTGIVPYVHPEGARVSSLRRIYAKRPYFTNGTAADLDAVLDRIRDRPGTFSHAGGPEMNEGALPPLDKKALRAFLELL